MFFVPTGTTNAIDTCDLVIATSSGADACSVSLLDGTTLLVAANVDDFAAEVNALYDDGPLVVGPFPLAGSQTCYLAGQKVQRVQPSQDPDECYVSLLSLRSLLLIAASLADVVDLLNTTAGGCGGGGGGGGTFVQSGASEGAPLVWVPTVTGGANNVASLSSAKFIRVGSGATAQQGDLVFVTISVNLTVTGANQPRFTFTAPPGAPPLNNMNVLTSALDNVPAPYPIYAFASQAPGNAIEVFTDVPTPGNLGLTLTAFIMYVVDGV